MSHSLLTTKWQGIQRVVVVGLGVTGLSVVKHLQRLPLELSIQVIDTRTMPPGLESLDSTVDVHSGSWNLDWLLEADLIVANPGIALSTPEIQKAIEKQIPVVGDIELFAWAAQAPVLAITGSNGKSTVTDLTGVLAKSAGLNVGVGGNIGIPALDLLSDDVELYVLELSSFQLETTSSLQLSAAAFLNLSEDHMDRYQGMEDYAAAKQRIFLNAQCAIVNRDEPETYPNNSIPTITFGFDEQDFGVVWLEAREYLSKQGQPLVAVEDLSLVGRHNVANSLVALALLDSVGVALENVIPALKTYTGLTHRCQLIVDNNGIKWVNDSKATNVASTIAALSGLQLSGRLHLLVGGVGKGADFSQLMPILQNIDVALHCFGQDGDQLLALHPEAQRWNTMEEAIQSIYRELKSGDLVMLSPACASFDQFKNFMARGDEFTRLARHYSQLSS